MGQILFNINHPKPIKFGKTAVKKTLIAIIKDYNKSFGKNSSLEYVFVDDEGLKDINITYLNHDYYTDIITFDNADDVNEIDGTIFISMDRVMENSIDFNVSRENELLRVMFHGLLHLCGLKDKTTLQKKAMRNAEDFYLNLHLQK